MMFDARQAQHGLPESRETLLTLLETLPGALFVIDDDATIIYTNALAQTLAGGVQDKLCGQSLWSGAPRVVSPSLYQAVQRVKLSGEPANVMYVSSATDCWLHASLSPRDKGMALLFLEHRESLPAHRALNQHERMYRELLESFADGVTIVTPDGLVLDINQRPLDDARLQREEVIGKPFADMPAWSSDPEVRQRLQDAIAQASQGETVRFEARIHPRPGFFLDILMTITSHRASDQRIEYLICAGRDITERKRSEDELLTLLDAIPDFVWIMRPDGSAAYANQRWCHYTDRTVEQIRGNGWLQFIHPEDRPRILQAWEKAVHTGTIYEVEHRIQEGNTKEYRWFLARGIPYRDAHGDILYWVGTCTDIEAQKQAEQKLKESQENWRILAETVPQLVWTMRADGWTDYSNQRFCTYTQTMPEQLQGYGWSQFLHPDDVERTFAARAHAFHTGTPYEVEYRLREGRTGNYRWFLARALPVHDAAGQITRWFGTCTDIDEQKRIEEALRQSQERANVLMNSNIIGINIIENGRIVDTNETFLRMTGYTRADLQDGRLSVKRLTAPEYWPQTRQAHRELATRQTLTPYEKEYICQDGSRLPVLVGGVLLKRHPFQALGFVLDNSARKELEQRKDSFISMASHELRNPLTALKLQTTLLRRHLSKQSISDTTQTLTRMENQINTITRLVEELLDVSKIQAGKLEYQQETVDLDALLREIAETIQQTQSSHRIQVSGSLPAPLIGDRDRLEQVFTNLLNNAIKYSPDADLVELELSSSPETAIVRVRDHGPGIPREQRDKIFERFYRANTPGQKAIPGLGMGLYIVAEIVKHHKGTITVESSIGQGSTFQVTLPISMASPLQ